MKFLKCAKNASVIPLKFIYSREQDVLMIVYKDLLLNKKFVENIDKPKVPVFIIKPEYRNQTGPDAIFDCSYRHDWLPKKLCDEHLVSYKNRKYEIAKLLNCHPNDVDDSPYVGWGDLDIKTIYFMEFLLEYETSIENYVPSVAYADIETDIKETKETGKMPITCIIYIDSEHRIAYQLVRYDKNYGGMDEVVRDVKDIAKSYNDLFDKEYGHFDYHVIIFEKEIEMLQAFWMIVRESDNDFIEYWNAPFDVMNECARIATLGVDPKVIVHDKDFKVPTVDLYEDPSPIVKRKKHKFDISVKPVITCQMRNYGGIRAAKAVIPTYKLNAIAEIEIGKNKVDYSEEGDLTKLLYSNLRKYLLYNVNDSLLQYGIDRKTKDTPTLYGKMYDFALTEPDAFVSTTMLIDELVWFGYKMEDLILANNRNKNPQDAQMLIQMGFGSDAATEEEAEELDAALIGDNDAGYDEDLQEIIDKVIDSQNVLDENGNKKKFAGAIVMHPKRQHYTGYKINGRPAPHVHRNTIDMDIGSEYPTGARAMNLSNDTWIGKVIMDNDDDLKFPMYQQYSFIGDDKTTYKMNRAAVFMETVCQGDYLMAGEIGFGLPSFSGIKKILKDEGVI